MKNKPLTDLARTIRSKNAGSFFYTIEIIFDDFDIYKKVKSSGGISQLSIAQLYGIAENQILDFCFYDPGMGIKANIRRKSASGGPGESDVYGCQQYAPLFSIMIPWDE
ncbi:DUF4387 domain-containing protein [Candidatus Atribacteria bacterium HGW-Atribacteria-1]|nr:MAG: DUF4387 domain-containing protein [Candidatus Atribacteria bacterium HGW-Atribacteria-1]